MVDTVSRLNQFAESLADKEFLEVVYEAEREATRVERMVFSARCEPGMDCGEYATFLKDLILYLRHGVRRGRVNEELYRCFEQIQDACQRSPFRGKFRETRISA